MRTAITGLIGTSRSTTFAGLIVLIAMIVMAAGCGTRGTRIMTEAVPSNARAATTGLPITSSQPVNYWGDACPSDDKRLRRQSSAVVTVHTVSVAASYFLRRL